jgi:hypothetical protein
MPAGNEAIDCFGYHGAVSDAEMDRAIRYPVSAQNYIWAEMTTNKYPSNWNHSASDYTKDHRRFDHQESWEALSFSMNHYETARAYWQKRASNNLGALLKMHPSLKSSLKTDKAFMRKMNTYYQRARFLVIAAEWWRVCSLTEYEEPNEVWKTYLLCWGVGVATRERWAWCYNPREKGHVPFGFSGTVKELLGKVMTQCPVPGSLGVDGYTAELLPSSNKACAYWPEETGSFSPQWKLPYGFAEAILKQRTDESNRKFELARAGISAVGSIISVLTGNTEVVMQGIEIAKITAEMIEKIGLNLGPLVPLLGMARGFTGKDFEIEDAFGAVGDPKAIMGRINELIGKGEDYLSDLLKARETLEYQVAKIKNMGWNYTEELLGNAIDFPITGKDWKLLRANK